MSIPTFRIGGVPEHFNFPWRLAHSHLGFEPQAADFTWQDYYGGTGFMREDLHADRLDLAVMLTEGAIADINHRPGLKIVGQYVSSPLHWGVHVHAEKGPSEVAALSELPFAISRKGSGSHLMAYVYAQQQGWDPTALEFVEVDNLDGARKALAEGKATTFLWEKFTTKPVVDSGEWRRMDVCPTPWPSFVVVGREEVLGKHPQAVASLMEQMQAYLTQIPSERIVELIHSDLQLKTEDIEAWLAQTTWSCTPHMDAQTLSDTQTTLQAVGQIKATKAAEDYVSQITEVK